MKSRQQTLLQNAMILQDKRCSLIPVKARTKKPLNPDWPNRAVSAQDLKTLVESADVNLGVLTGKPSNFLIDVDIDDIRALEVAPLVLPETSAMSGRTSKPKSHYFYRVSSGTLGSFQKVQWQKKCLAELRTSGYTLIPGSMHPEGEVYEGDISEPAVVDFDDLLTRFRIMCAVTILKDCYPPSGGRHDFVLNLSGYLAHAGHRQSFAENLVDVLVEAVGDEEFEDREVCVRTTYERFGAGQNVKGKLQELVGDEAYCAIRKILSGPTVSSVGHADEGSRALNLKRNQIGELVAVRDNIKILVEQSDAWEGVFAWNTRTESIYLLRMPPVSIAEAVPTPLTSRIVLKIADWLTQEHGLHANTRAVEEALQLIAGKVEYDPVVSYLHDCGAKWDRRPRLDAMLKTYFNASDSPYTSVVGRKWMISAVARAMSPGCKADHVLVLESRQGDGKSTAFEVLAGIEYCGEDAPSLTANNGKEFVEWCQRLWIAQISELHALRRADAAHIKSVISNRVDRYRPSYGRDVVVKPRKYVFGATTNETEYLTDPTGSRRFLGVRLHAPIDLAALKRDRDQLWGEAVCRYETGEKWYLEGEEVKWAEAEQDERLIEDPFERYILDAAE